jgi:hypothetical protein
MKMEDEAMKWFIQTFGPMNGDPVLVGHSFIPMPDPSEWPATATEIELETEDRTNIAD